MLPSVRLDDLAAPAADQFLPMMESMWLVGGRDEGSPFEQAGHRVDRASTTRRRLGGAP
jgi:hypothetical protein